MKEDIEEPVKKNWKLFMFLVLMILLLSGTAVLIVKWYIENSQMPDFHTNKTAVIVSGTSVAVLLLTLIIVFISLYGKKNKGSKKKSSKNSSLKGRKKTSRKRNLK